jgi:hypothetical protein
VEKFSNEEFLMRPENEARLKKIRWVSSILRAICKVFLALCGLGLLFAVLCLTGLVGIGNDFGSGGTRIVVVGLMVVLMGLGFKCGYHLYRLLGNCSRGEIFTKESAEQIRQWGIACVLLGVVKFAIRFLPRVVLSHMHGPSEGLEGLGWVVNGLIIVAISWFMAMAAEMREENELTV